jgi:aminoglycoside 6'-N-acetyltransferase
MAPLRSDRVVLRPLEAADAPVLRAARAAPEVAAWWGPLEDDFPFGDEPGATRLAITVDGEVVGMVQFTEEPDPDSRHADIDIFLDPQHQDRGLGTDALTTLADHLLGQRGHHRLTLTTATENARAIRCYEKVGFRRVGVLQASARDRETGGWRDELLMELVVPPVRRPTSGRSG